MRGVACSRFAKLLCNILSSPLTWYVVRWGLIQAVTVLGSFFIKDVLSCSACRFLSHERDKWCHIIVDPRLLRVDSIGLLTLRFNEGESEEDEDSWKPGQFTSLYGFNVSRPTALESPIWKPEAKQVQLQCGIRIMQTGSKLRLMEEHGAKSCAHTKNNSEDNALDNASEPRFSTANVPQVENYGHHSDTATNGTDRLPTQANVSLCLSAFLSGCGHYSGGSDADKSIFHDMPSESLTKLRYQVGLGLIYAWMFRMPLAALKLWLDANSYWARVNRNRRFWVLQSSLLVGAGFVAGLLMFPVAHLSVFEECPAYLRMYYNYPVYTMVLLAPLPYVWLEWARHSQDICPTRSFKVESSRRKVWLAMQLCLVLFAVILFIYHVVRVPLELSLIFKLRWSVFDISFKLSAIRLLTWVSFGHDLVELVIAAFRLLISILCPDAEHHDGSQSSRPLAAVLFPGSAEQLAAETYGVESSMAELEDFAQDSMPKIVPQLICFCTFIASVTFAVSVSNVEVATFTWPPLAHCLAGPIFLGLCHFIYLKSNSRVYPTEAVLKRNNREVVSPGSWLDGFVLVDGCSFVLVNDHRVASRFPVTQKTVDGSMIPVPHSVVPYIRSHGGRFELPDLPNTVSGFEVEVSEGKTYLKDIDGVFVFLDLDAQPSHVRKANSFLEESTLEVEFYAKPHCLSRRAWVLRWIWFAFLVWCVVKAADPAIPFMFPGTAATFEQLCCINQVSSFLIYLFIHEFVWNKYGDRQETLTHTLQGLRALRKELKGNQCKATLKVGEKKVVLRADDDRACLCLEERDDFGSIFDLVGARGRWSSPADVGGPFLLPFLPCAEGAGLRFVVHSEVTGASEKQYLKTDDGYFVQLNLDEDTATLSNVISTESIEVEIFFVSEIVEQRGGDEEEASKGPSLTSLVSNSLTLNADARANSEAAGAATGMGGPQILGGNRLEAL